MLRFFLLVLPVFAHAGFFDWLDPLSPKAEKAKEALADFDETIEKTLADYQVPGLCIGIIVDGHMVYAKGFGYRDLEAKLPMTKDTLCPIGSCTKAFTTFVMGNLVDEGLLEWDVPVTDILPEFRLWDQHATAYATLRDLLIHRTGLPRHDLVYYNSQASKDELLRRIRYLEPSHQFRERYHYGQLTYFIAGMALEKVAGKPWNTLIQEQILTPLSMKKTNFSVEATKKTSDYAHPYVEKNDRFLKMPLRNLDLIGPAGAMNSNIEELGTWMKMLLAGGVHNDKSLINRSTLEEICSPQVNVPGLAGSKELSRLSYGIGWTVGWYRSHYLAYHDGISDGFTCVLNILPDDNIGVVIICNRNMSALPRYLTVAVLDRLLQAPYRDWMKEGAESFRKNKETAKQTKLEEDRQRKKNTTPTHSLSSYVGIYEHPGYGKLAIELVGDKLELNYNDMTFVLDHWHHDVFSVVEEKQLALLSFEGAKINFRNTPDGEVDQIIVPFEATSSGIVFQKKPSEKHGTLTYLRQFVGSYEFYGYNVDILLKNHALIAVIPGQPNYELIPAGENEFSVKSMNNASVRFVVGPTGKVEEALIVYPYGAFAATPKR